MHHLKHLWHTIQILPIHVSITDEGQAQLLCRDQLIEPRVHRLRHTTYFVSQTELSNVVKVLILVAHDYISREGSNKQICSSDGPPAIGGRHGEPDADIVSIRTLLASEVHVDQNHDYCSKESCRTPTARANRVLDVF